MNKNCFFKKICRSTKFWVERLPRIFLIVHFSSVQLLSRVQPFVTPQPAAHQASLSITNSRRFLRLMSVESVVPSNHLILCHPLLLPSIFPSIRVFSNESVLCLRWPKLFEFQPQHQSFQWIFRTDFLWDVDIIFRAFLGSQYYWIEGTESFVKWRHLLPFQKTRNDRVTRDFYGVQMWMRAPRPPVQQMSLLPMVISEELREWKKQPSGASTTP